MHRRTLTGLIFATALGVAGLGAHPAAGQVPEGPAPIYTAVHGDTVVLYVTQPPPAHDGFVVYRSGAGEAQRQLTTVPVRPAPNAAAFASRLGPTTDLLMARLGVDTELALFRLLQADPFSAYVTGLIYPEAGRALGRVYRDTSARAGATYRYRLVYLDADGEETDEVRTVQVAVEPRSVAPPTGVELDAGPARVRVAWEYPEHSGEPDDAVFSFHVERAEGTGPFRVASAQPIARNDVGTLEWVDRSVQPGAAYRYRVRPVDLAGRLGPASETVSAAAVDDAPPRRPLDVVTTPGEGRVRVDWRVAPQARVEGYHVERSTGLSEPFTRLTTDALIPVASPTYVDSTVIGARQYFYRVLAVDTAGVEGPASNPMAATPSDTTPPTAPSDLTLDADERTIELAWAPSTSADVTGYHVFRGESPDRLIRVTEDPISDTSFVDTGAEDEGGLHPGRRYHLSVLALDGSGNASAGLRDSVTVPDDLPPDPPTALQAESHHGRWVQLRWSASPTGDVASYEMRRLGTDTVAVGARTASAEFALRDTTVSTGSQYTYELVAVDSAGNRSEPAVDTLLFADPTPPPAPRHIAVRQTETGVEILWERVVSRDLAGYRVYRARIPTGVYEPLVDLIPADAERVYVDIEGDGRDYYRVRAVDTSGNLSDPTDPRRATEGGS